MARVADDRKMRQKLNLVTLEMNDFQKSDKSMDGLALFDLGGIILALHSRHKLTDDTTLTYQPTTFSGLTVSHNTTQNLQKKWKKL